RRFFTKARSARLWLGALRAGSGLGSTAIMSFGHCHLLCQLNMAKKMAECKGFSALGRSAKSGLRKYDYRIDFDEIFGRGHLRHLDHRRGRRGRPEILAPDFMNEVEVLHVAHVNVDPADVVEGAARLLDRRLQVLAHLARLRLDVADARDGAIGAARGHAGDEHQLPRSGADRVREMAA